MKHYNVYAILSLFVFLFTSCGDKKEDENVDENVDKETIATNEWIKENMELYYYWNEQMPSDIDYKKESDPIEYFKKLVYTDEDRWSWITEDYASLAADFSGIPVTMGYYPSFYLYGEGTDVFIVVNYVYPGSPAAKAGLKRGDIIYSIDNTKLNDNNYYDLFSGDNYTVQLANVENQTIVPLNKSLNMTAAVTTTDPSVFSKVLDINNTKIGYLVYVKFVSGDDDIFITTLDSIFNEFKSEGISEIIIDFRYNPGGEINAATYLASQFAPSSVVANEKVMVNMQYNTGFQYYLEQDEAKNADFLSYKFSNNSSNINLSRAYFLTSSQTASASELVITGLDPYMEIVTIGDTTHGKYTGAWVMPDDDKKWAMVPIVLKYANIEGFTDFTNGLVPNYKVKDDLLNKSQFGELSDPLLAKAVDLIAGTNYSSSMVQLKSSQPYTGLYPYEFELNRNLFVKRYYQPEN
jgi:C-terminal processing protease CtpA/Prc